MTSARRIAFEPELIDRLVDGYDARAVFEPDGVLDRLRLVLSERFAAPGLQERTVDTRSELLRLESRYADLSERIVSLYLRGYRPHEIARRLSTLVGEDIGEEVAAQRLADLGAEALGWQERALDSSYPIVAFEGVRVKWKGADGAKSKLCHFALGFQSNGTKEVLGIWLDNGDEGTFWQNVVSDLSARGVENVLYLMVPRRNLLNGCAAVIDPIAVVENPCDLIRQSLALATAKDRSSIQRSLRTVHSAPTEPAARTNLARLGHDPIANKYPGIKPLWERHWDDVAPFFDIPPEVRRVMTSIHASEGLRRALQRALRAHGQLNSAEDARTLMYVAVRDTLRKWRRPQREWHAAKTQLSMLFPERFVP